MKTKENKVSRIVCSDSRGSMKIFKFLLFDCLLHLHIEDQFELLQFQLGFTVHVRDWLSREKGGHAFLNFPRVHFFTAVLQFGENMLYVLHYMIAINLYN